MIVDITGKFKSRSSSSALGTKDMFLQKYLLPINVTIKMFSLIHLRKQLRITTAPIILLWYCVLPLVLCMQKVCQIIIHQEIFVSLDFCIFVSLVLILTFHYENTNVSFIRRLSICVMQSIIALLLCSSVLFFYQCVKDDHTYIRYRLDYWARSQWGERSR